MKINKRHLVGIYILLVIIVGMQFYIINKTNKIQADVVNIGGYISEKADNLTTKVNTYLID